jgi:hypothetical protein
MLISNHDCQILNGSKKVKGLTKQEIVIHVNPNKLIDYTIMWAQTLIMHATSYGILFEGMILYSLKVIIDLCEEITYYQLGW